MVKDLIYLNTEDDLQCLLDHHQILLFQILIAHQRKFVEQWKNHVDLTIRYQLLRFYQHGERHNHILYIQDLQYHLEIPLIQPIPEDLHVYHDLISFLIMFMGIDHLWI